MRELSLIGFFGALGAMGRYGIGLAMAQWTTARFPWATFIVNVLGSLLLGLLMVATIETQTLSREWKVALGTGLLGAFTTYATFSYETLALIEGQSLRLAVANVVANLVCGLGAVFAGLVLGRLLFRA